MSEQKKGRTQRRANQRRAPQPTRRIRNRRQRPAGRTRGNNARPAANGEGRREKRKASTTTPHHTLRHESLSTRETQIIKGVLARYARAAGKHKGDALRNACRRLIERAEADARAGNPRLLEAVIDALKPRTLDVQINFERHIH